MIVVSAMSGVCAFFAECNFYAICYVRNDRVFRYVHDVLSVCDDFKICDVCLALTLLEMSKLTLLTLTSNCGKTSQVLYSIKNTFSCRNILQIFLNFRTSKNDVLMNMSMRLSKKSNRLAIPCTRFFCCFRPPEGMKTV